jgi:hypothetical protein
MLQRHTGHFAIRQKYCVQARRFLADINHHRDENERTDGAVSYVQIAALTTT